MGRMSESTSTAQVAAPDLWYHVGHVHSDGAPDLTVTLPEAPASGTRLTVTRPDTGCPEAVTAVTSGDDRFAGGPDGLSGTRALVLPLPTQREVFEYRRVPLETGGTQGVWHHIEAGAAC
jgi:hypothetical protein